MKAKHILILIVASLMLTACPTCDFTSTYTYVVNNSRHSISVYWASTAANTSAYPDTLLPDNPVLCGTDVYELIDDSVEANGGMAVFEYPTSLDGFKKLFSREEHLPEGILSVFIIHTDTLHHCSWSCLRETNNYIVRYDLSYDDIVKFVESDVCNEFYIPFPPTEAMRYMKMWPPYEEIANKYKYSNY